MLSPRIYHYELYGLHVASELELPELLPLAAESRPIDLHIRLAAVDCSRFGGELAMEGDCEFTAQRFRLHIDELADYLVCDGQSITIAAQAQADAASLRLYLLGSCLGALLFQRGLLVLHGNALRMGDQGVVCVGDSGAGKSTLAAAFWQAGYSIIADDLAAVDAQGRLIPGFPRMKLLQDSADRLGISTSGLQRICPELDKFNLPLGQAFCREPVPLTHLFWLHPSDVTELRLEPLNGQEKFRLLRDHLFRGFLLHDVASKRHLLQQAARLAGQLRCNALHRPRQGCSPQQMVERIRQVVNAEARE